MTDDIEKHTASDMADALRELADHIEGHDDNLFALRLYAVTFGHEKAGELGELLDGGAPDETLIDYVSGSVDPVMWSGQRGPDTLMEMVDSFVLADAQSQAMKQVTDEIERAMAADAVADQEVN